eukprot:353182-Chlamydomonas_euryale.AAC.30
MHAAAVRYVSRAEYADRDAMLCRAAAELQALDTMSKQAGSEACCPLLLGLFTHVTIWLAMSPGFWLCQRVAVLPEGAQGGLAMLGMVRMVEWLARAPDGLPNPMSNAYVLVIDSGTGTSAIGG